MGGDTSSTDFPVTSGAYLPTAPANNYNQVYVGFLSVVDTAQSGMSSLRYSTFFGGSGGNSDINTITTDSVGNAYVAGASSTPNFPVTPGAYQTILKGHCNGTVSELMPLGNGSADLAYSTFFGGTSDSQCANGDIIYRIALDATGNAYVTGTADSTDFPISTGAYQTTLNGTSDAFVAKLSLTPKVLPTPIIGSLSISSGSTGTNVMISGSNFGMNQGSSTVNFGTVSAVVSSWSSGSIIVQVPSEGTPGIVQVSVTTTLGNSNSKSFTVIPSITSLSPTSGPVAASVTIAGYNFGSPGTVTFNGVTATTTSWNSSTIVAKVPVGAASGNVVVTSNSTMSAGITFTVVATPSISNLSTSSGIAGTTVTISGANFGASQPSEAGAVVFNGASAFVERWSSGSIDALVPYTSTPGSGGITVTVGGVASNSYPFTVDPSISSLSSYAGVVGQSLSISGADFGSTQGTVKFGSSVATINAWSPTQISVTVPNLPQGSVSLNITAASIATNSLWFTVTGAAGTAPPATPPVPGLPPFGSFAGGPDQIDLGNLNVHLDIPVLSKLGRGTPFNYTLKYDSSVWYPGGAPGNVSWQPVNNWGWAGQSSVMFGSLSYVLSVLRRCADGLPYATYYGWSFADKFGVTHVFNVGGVASDANCGSTTQTGMATDGTGYSLSVSAIPNSSPQAFNATVTSKTGRQFNPPVNASSGPGTFTDRNGNQITLNSSGVFTDTLGTPALTVAGTAPNPVKFAYTPPAGGTVYMTVTYKVYSIQTAFGCSNVHEYANPSTPLVDKITYPDGTFYQFQYELTPGSTVTYTGRVASVTLPTGGTISYTYTGGSTGHITCSDGSSSGFKRYTPDTGSSAYWNYARSTGSGAASTTTITDPTSQANVTVVQFQGIYETQRQSYQGSSTLLRTITTCYNGSASPCTGNAIGLPITQRSVTTQLAGVKSLAAQHVYRYDSSQNLLEQDDYDYSSNGPGSLLKKKVLQYAALGNNLTGFPQLVTVTDPSGNYLSQTQYIYDQTGVVATSGTPQHVAVSGSRGNVSKTNTYTTGSTYLTKSFTYFDTGNVQIATDVNGAQSTYTYGACGNSFPTSVSEPLSLSRSMTWNCTGAVQTSMTDENLKVWSTSYTKDAFFWRPDSRTDPSNAATSLTYTGATQAESVLSIVSGTSASDVLNSLDSMGRQHLSQIRQTPGGTSFDTTEEDYDIEGRASRVTLPFGAAAGVGSSSAPAKTTTYDALGRIVSTADSGGGSITNSYSQNDVIVTRGPAPNAENTKRHQSEYDALGRLASICEITSASGSGACSQNTAATGFWTKYTYDGLGRLTGVTQNAQSGTTQVRSYTYDVAGRKTSAKDPETGNIAYTYTYDSDSTCNSTSAGDLVKRVDAVGNVTCFAYDPLHRNTSITYPSGSYSSKTPSKYFIYDSATVNGLSMTNTKAKLAEAYTCVSPCTTKITDLGIGYTVRGEPSDVYEKTPNSGGYYHVAEQYWANGRMKQLNGLSGLPTFTFAVDGEGRNSQVSASTGQNPVTNTVFNNASLATSVTFGSSDSDSFTYDPNTDRMTQYQFTVNGQSLTGALTWNANATLQALKITDALNSADNQSCTFAYDDLARLESTDCGAVWSQTYSYDAFGNIVKNGSAAFQPTYNLATNRITSVAGFTPTYDNNGNTLTDPLHTYSWDSAGKPVAVDSVNMTYDALGRMVEQNRSGVFTQFAYGPHGGKFAILSGQTVQKAFVPLPGGAQAVYNASGLLYYGHSDHLGSVRVGSTSARAVSFDVAYAPFGETYAASGSADPAFTGQRQDTVNGLYDFPEREYSSQGRWPSADPSGTAAFHLTDPQSINRYVYARNTPLSMVDPTGLDDCVDSSDPFACGDGNGVGGGGGVSGGAGASGSWDPLPSASTPNGGLDPIVVAPPTSIEVNGTPDTFATQNSVLPDTLVDSAAAGAAVGAIGATTSELDSVVNANASVVTPWGTALQETTPEALNALDQVQSGATLYRYGVTGVQETTGAQFWSLTNPLTTPNYGNVMGMPTVATSEGVPFVMGGQLLPGASVITRAAPGLADAVGGAIEAVTATDAVELLFFVTLP